MGNQTMAAGVENSNLKMGGIVQRFQAMMIFLLTETNKLMVYGKRLLNPEFKTV
jgi:hypothetical protein